MPPIATRRRFTMKTQTVRTNPTALGLFLTLILNSRPKPKSANENPSKVCGVARISPAGVLRREEATAETRTFPARRTMLGPFVRLILRLAEQRAAERLRFAAEHNSRASAMCAYSSVL